MPLPIISVAQMREWEKATWAAGQTEAEVIRRVGRAVALRALRMTGPGDLILILAGKGNNGADAQAAAEHLKDRRVESLKVEHPDAEFSKLEEFLSHAPAIIIDGLFGIGINRPLDEHWQKLIAAINHSRIPVLAVDVPSGLNAETGRPEGAALEAAVTLTVGAPKSGLLKQSAWASVGRLEVADDVGLSAAPPEGELNWTLPRDFDHFQKRRPAAGHKGSFGHLAIVAGSLGYHGAAVMAARSAQRARPGMISLFTHEPAYYPVAAQLQAVMVHPWSLAVEFPGKFDAVLLGPGLAAPDVPDDLKNMARRLWSNAPVPVILDASALDWLRIGPFAANTIRVILPHPGEAARQLRVPVPHVQADRPRILRDLSKKFGNCYVVLKGHQTLIGRGDEKIFVNPSGNPDLAQGGAGDILGGFLAALLAQPDYREDVLKTIRFAVWKHGAEADRLSREKPNWVVEELIENLGIQSK